MLACQYVSCGQLFSRSGHCHCSQHTVVCHVTNMAHQNLLTIGVKRAKTTVRVIYGDDLTLMCGNLRGSLFLILSVFVLWHFISLVLILIKI